MLSKSTTPIGGECYGGGDCYSSWMFDKAEEQWTQLPNSGLRDGSYAGLVTYPSGENAVVVAGGYYRSNSVIFNLETETWRSGPDLPTRLGGGASVQLQDTFLVVTGNDPETGFESEAIYKFVTSPEEGWLQLPHKCRTVTSDAILVPQDFIECNLGIQDLVQ